MSAAMKRILAAAALLLLATAGRADAQPNIGGGIYQPNPGIDGGGGTPIANCNTGNILFGSAGFVACANDTNLSSNGGTGNVLTVGTNSSAVTQFFLQSSTGTLQLRAAGAALNLGAPDNPGPGAQSIAVQNVSAGTSNTAGAAFTLKGSQGTGTGAGGSLIFQTAPAGGAGASQNALATALTIDSTKLAAFAGNITVAGTQTNTSNSATCFTIGPNGSTNPGLTVACDAGTAASGLLIRGNGTATGLVMSATNSASNGNLTLDAKGTGTMGFGTTSTGAITLGTSAARVNITGGLTMAGSVPTPSGTCPVNTQTGGNTAGTFKANGACAAGTVILTFATTAPTGWHCRASDQTTPADLMNQTASSTTTCTLTGTMANLDVVAFSAVAF